MFNFDSTFKEMMQSHNLDTVIILGHMNPDGDAAGSVMSLAHYIHVNYPQYKVIPYLAETLERGPKKLVLEDKVFTPFEKPDTDGKTYCVIVCDNATLKRMVGLEYFRAAAASIVVDHHVELVGSHNAVKSVFTGNGTEAAARSEITAYLNKKLYAVFIKEFLIL